MTTCSLPEHADQLPHAHHPPRRRPDHELDDPRKPEYRGVSGWLLIIWVVFWVILVAALVLSA